MKYKILIDYEDLRQCPPFEGAGYHVELNKGDVIDVLFVEAAGSGKYFADKNHPLFRGYYLASYMRSGEVVYMIDFELLSLIAERVE